MAKTWFTSDLHLRHTSILKYTDRDSEKGIRINPKLTFSLEERMRFHDDWIISQINTFVGERDYLYLIGDLVLGANKWQAGYLISQINCKHKVLVGGNHDEKLMDFYRDSGLFETVHAHRTEIKLNGRRLILDHHPIVEWNGGHHGTWHLHGHCHGNFDYKAANLHDKRILDVGWDNAVKVLGEYRPFEFEDLDKYMTGRVSISHHGNVD
jgi:calcineurin-like phosphoesterase family protein